jgi:hypothetical protein
VLRAVRERTFFMFEMSSLCLINDLDKKMNSSCLFFSFSALALFSTSLTSSFSFPLFKFSLSSS